MLTAEAHAPSTSAPAGKRPEWNPFIRRFSGALALGARVEVVLQPDQSKSATYRPTIVEIDPGVANDALHCQGVVLDTLTSRERQVALFEVYGALLTDHQRRVLDLYLRQDWSLSEVAGHQETSRAAVHDLVRRAALAMEEYERRLGLLAEQGRRRDARAEVAQELTDLRRRLARAEAMIERI